MSDYLWTKHALYKMNQYALSEQKVRSVVRKPFRVEEGIVKNTIAVMIPTGKFVITKEGEKPNWKQELWVMYQARRARNPKSQISNSKQNEIGKHQMPASPAGGQKARFKIISAWRYPGVSPKNNPIPEDILREIISASR